MEHNEPLVIKFWKNPEVQLLQIDKEIQYLQMGERYEFLEKYRQALYEFLDIFDSYSFLKRRYINTHLPSDESESLASMLFHKYSFWNNECDSYDVQLWDECEAVDSYLSELVGLSAILSQMNEFMQLFLSADSNYKFIDECIAHFSLSNSQVEFILSLSLTRLKNADPQSIEDDIEIYSAISEFIKRMAFGCWQRNEKEGDNIEVSYQFDVKEKEWKKHCKIEEDDKSMIRYFFNTETNEWEKISKLEFEPSYNSYTWDKQNEKWQLKEEYDVVLKKFGKDIPFLVECEENEGDLIDVAETGNFGNKRKNKDKGI